MMKHFFRTSFKVILMAVHFIFMSACNDQAYFAAKMEATAIEPNEVSDQATDKGEEVSDSSSEEVPVPIPVDVLKGSEICKGGAKACDLTPVVSKAGVVTILMALGDLAKDKIVITEDSARLIAQNAVKYASPVEGPKILVVKDFNHNGESEFDTEYIAEVLLANYKTDVLHETALGLESKDLEGYDLIWFNNPGYPMGSEKTLNVLKSFSGGVILSGDDLTQGRGFSTESLTGLKLVNNGTSLSCNGQRFQYDNNGGHRYQVSLLDQFLPGIPEEIRSFEYGNDIDDSHLAFEGDKFEVLAYANGEAGTCYIQRPVIVRYVK